MAEGGDGGQAQPETVFQTRHAKAGTGYVEEDRREEPNGEDAGEGEHGKSTPRVEVNQRRTPCSSGDWTSRTSDGCGAALLTLLKADISRSDLQRPAVRPDNRPE